MPVTVFAFFEGRYHQGRKKYKPGDKVEFPLPWAEGAVSWTVPEAPGEYRVTAHDGERERVLATIKIS